MVAQRLHTAEQAGLATVGKLEKNEVNTGLLDLVRQSDVLKQISK